MLSKVLQTSAGGEFVLSSVIGDGSGEKRLTVEVVHKKDDQRGFAVRP
jgi:hypothetical protein